LFEVVEVDKVRCLNERVFGSCKKVFRPTQDRSKFANSSLRPAEGDPELLLVIPFSEEVKVRAVALICGESKPEGAGL
jgi:PITH domain